jgi:hypothetical protein
MFDPHEFARKQLELTAEFGKFVFDHPKVEARLPDGAYVYFDIAGDHVFNQYSRERAESHSRANGTPLVLVRVKELAPPQGSRLVEPVIEPRAGSGVPDGMFALRRHLVKRLGIR